MVMALSMRTVASWEWMPPLRQGEKSRRGLGLLFLAPFSFLLLGPPMVALLLIPWFVILVLFLSLNHPAAHSNRFAGDGGFDWTTIVPFVTILAIYYWLLGRSLKRFTGSWHRGLFVRVIVWISGIVAIQILLARHFNGLGFPGAPMYSANNFWWFLLWVISTVALSRAGAIFGQWLAGRD